MCISPIRIKNPNHGNYISKYTRLHKDTESQYINVPCGNCPACRFLRQANYFQRALIESLNSYVFFVTLTYNNESIVTAELNGEFFTIAPFSDIQLLNKRLRNNNPFGGRNFKFLAVREYGKRTGRAHWHLLYFVQKKLYDNTYTPFEFSVQFEKALLQYYSKNLGTDNNPIYISNFTDKIRFAGGKMFRPFDCQYIDTDKSILPLFYVLKYISKDSALYKKMQILAEAEADARTDRTKQQILNDFKPKVWKSIHFGLPISPEGEDIACKVVRKSIDMSISSGADFPTFFLDDVKLPLCNYYKTKFMTEDEDLFFKRKQISQYGFPFYDSPDEHTIATAIQRNNLRMSRFHDEDIYDIVEIDN